ncbi:MAG TPA: hypothetical protein VN648_04325, partial [Candidatus Methylomirabilis sp.]|nr:hypothetical protein [Candidatus Methylomirabilis sp.]
PDQASYLEHDDPEHEPKGGSVAIGALRYPCGEDVGRLVLTFSAAGLMMYRQPLSTGAGSTSRCSRIARP